MTKLIVRPIDATMPGSYRERQAFFKVLRAFQAAKRGDDEFTSLDAFDAMEQFLLKRIATDDETPVEDVLNQLSANEFDTLIGSIYEAPVGEATASS